MFRTGHRDAGAAHRRLQKWGMPQAQPRVAVIGAGPSGLYAAAALVASGSGVSVDVLDRLPAPYGLVRYGVAPDHVKMKNVIRVLQKPFEPAEVHFLGNVRIGEDGVPLDVLREHYHAIIHATGSSLDRALGVPGEDLAGSLGSGAFVSWYSGHPDHIALDPQLDHPGVAVVGAGNVALDVARVLAKHAVDLRSTEIADNVLAGLEASAVTDVHVFGRRGPADIKFTPIELRELGEVPNVDIVVHDEDFVDADPANAANNQLKVMLRVLNSWRTREATGASRRLHLHFYHSPVEVLGDGKVEGIRFERTEPTGDGRVRGTGEFREIAVQQVYRAVGYYGTPVVGAPFDESRGVIPNVEGRVTDVRTSTSEPIPGLYATGWIKRGPVGLIGHTKSDAMETIAHLVADAEAGVLTTPTIEADVLDLLEERGVAYTTWDGWLALDAHERELGANHQHTRERVKVVPRDEQVEISRAGACVSEPGVWGGAPLRELTLS